ncbi:MAG: SLC13 family permease [Ardenticatenaceae bacterium]|nr:SLC13 family permease [Ardenticatenaceae bacterium]MCB8989424.1 SLC13 family permease [Ardenticatenaceae bacterium]
MTLEAWIILSILIVAVILFITEWLRVDVVALGVVVALMLTGSLSTAEALAGFSNSAVLTIAALFIVGGAVLQTGLAGMIGRRILQVAGNGELRLTFVLMTAVALMSSFMSDTGTVAVLLPAVVILARGAKIAPSRLLIPLAFGSLLGGASTLIGTPPNIIVSDLLRENGLTPFSFFSYTPMGAVLIVLGIGYMALLGRRLLPDRRVQIDAQSFKSPEELVDLYRLPDNLYRLRVRRASDLIGKSLAAAGLRREFNITVLDILRREEPRPVLQLVWGRQRDAERPLPPRTSITPEPDTLIELDDVLLVQGETEAITQMAAKWNLGVRPARDDDEANSLLNDEVGVAEVLIPPRSRLIGKTLIESRFGTTYRLTVLGLTGPSAKEKLDIKSTPLRFGDILLVQGPWKNIADLRKQQRDFVVMGQPESMIAAPYRQKAAIALVILLGMVAVLVADLLPIATASLLAALLMVLTGCLTMDDAYRAIDWKSIVLVAGMLPMSTALEKVGLVDLAAQGLVDSLGQIDALAVLAGLFLLTSLFTQVLSNTATTVVVAPIALAAAHNLGIAPHAFLMAVALAASMAFATPVASPVNTLVMGAGDYRFGDYIKVGVPLILIGLLASVLLLPLLFPF